MKYIYRPNIIMSQHRKDFFMPHDTTNDRILEDAIKIWSKFREQVIPLNLKNELYVPAQTCDEHPANYALHHAWVTGEESGISKNNLSARFSSLYRLLDATILFMASDSYGHVYYISNVYDAKLQQKRNVKIDVCIGHSRLANGEEVIHLNADYSDEIKDREGLPAPITLVPFNAIQEALTSYVKQAFSNWDTTCGQYQAPEGYLIRDYSNHRFTEFGDGRVPKWKIHLPLIQECCKELDKSFELDFNFFRSKRIEIVKESDLLKAQSLFVSTKTLKKWENKKSNKKTLGSREEDVSVNNQEMIQSAFGQGSQRGKQLNSYKNVFFASQKEQKETHIPRLIFSPSNNARYR